MSSLSTFLAGRVTTVHAHCLSGWPRRAALLTLPAVHKQEALLHDGELSVRVFRQHAVEALVVLGGEQLLELGRGFLEPFEALRRARQLHIAIAQTGCIGATLVEVHRVLGMFRADLFQGLMDLILCNLLDNTRAEIVIRNATFDGHFTPTLFEVLDLLMYPCLLPHDALNVNLVGVVVIFNQRGLDGLLEPFRVHG